MFVGFFLGISQKKKKKANQLDFLLSKASEYSNFIARDLDELQNAMTEQARQNLEKQQKKSKKRRGSGGDEATPGNNKKSKTAPVKPIFVQPPNLAKGCILKDYQLEGVRWLASLFENGVSGILADGKIFVAFLYVICNLPPARHTLNLLLQSNACC